jgi:hypothetical protein
MSNHEVVKQSIATDIGFDIGTLILITIIEKSRKLCLC